MADARWHPGTFVWRELVTSDVEAARRFYGELFGWTWKGEPMGPAGTYWHAWRGDRQVAGALTLPGAPMAPTWSSYVLVDDVDAAAARCTSAGGSVLRPPDDIPGVGRFAVLADPWGAGVFPFRGPDGEAPPPAARPPAGTFCWETLVTPDPAAAVAFYRQVVGFGTARTPNGEGTGFTAGDLMVADVQPARPGGRSYWATYVAVDDAEGARDAAVRLGGKVIVPRVDVPQVGIVSVIADPSGATLGLFQAVRSA